MKNPFIKPLLILPFDHRSTFAKGFLGYKYPLKRKQAKKVTELKEIVYNAFKKSLPKYKDPSNFGVLIDEDYGASIIRDAKKLGCIRAVTTEKSGKKEFQFQYGNQFGKHLLKFKPDYAKALVRYNPANKKVNARQLKRLARLSAFCKKNDLGLLFELLVPPTEKDLKKAGSQEAYDRGLRIDLTVKAIKEIRTSVDVDIWKLEGTSKAGWKRILPTLEKQDRVIVLGRGEDESHVKRWLENAADFDQIIGFAVGRTIFAKPLKEYLTKKITKKQATERIAKNYQSFVHLWGRRKRMKF